MGKIKSSQRVILFTLCSIAVVRCDSQSNSSSKNSNSNPHSIQTSELPKIRNSAKFRASQIQVLQSSFSPSENQTIQIHPDENTRRKRRQVNYPDYDSDSESTANFPHFDIDINPTIVNGTEVDLSAQIPYQLSIRFQAKPPFGEWKHICGAVILDENTAITAGHCFGLSEDANRYRVVAGENLLEIYEKQEQVLGVKKIVIHPEFTDFSNGHDIAILHVDKIQLNEFARGVWLSTFPAQKLADLTGVISGWGKISRSDSGDSNSLQKGDMTILSPKNCHPRLRRLRVAVAGILCALNPETRACNGDSGGPLVIQNYKLPGGNSRVNLLVGIISFGIGKCDIPNSAGFFTEISYFYDWIQEERAKKPKPTTQYFVEITSPPVQQLKSCSAAMEILPSPRSEKQTIYPHGNNTSLEVLCDFEVDGGGWTIIQKRTSGPKQEFDQNWTEYSSGFGSLNGNFWIGLENIHALTKNGDQELRIQLEDFGGEKRWAKYSSFYISDASDFYRLTIGGFSGTAGDSMTDSNHPTYILNGMRFSTKDVDNDNWIAQNCADFYSNGGWWLNDCGESTLNGPYFEKGETTGEEDGIYWHSWKGRHNSLAKSEMKIRTRKF